MNLSSGLQTVCNLSKTEENLTETDQSTSSEVLAIELCEGNELECGRHWIFLLIHIICIIINIIHIVILNHISALKQKPYLKILQHLTIGDVVYNSFDIPLCICSLRNWLFASFDLSYAAVLHLLRLVSLCARFNLLVLTTYEKYLAICKPYRYEQSVAIRHVHLSAMVTWILSVALILPGWIFFWRDTCWNQIYGPMYSTGNDAGRLYNGAVAILLTVILLVFAAQILHKLVKMNKAHTTYNGLDFMLMRAGAYVITISLIYVICQFTPVIIMAAVRMVERRTYLWTDIFSYSLWLSYGYINTFLYGWFSPAYRRQAHTLVLGIIGKTLRISPTTAELSVTHAQRMSTIRDNQTNNQ